MSFLTYPFPVNDVVELKRGQIYKTSQHALSRFDAPQSRYEISLFDKVFRTYLNFPVPDRSGIEGFKFTFGRFSRRLRVRLKEFRVVRGYTVVVSVDLPFRWSKTSVVVGRPAAALSVLSLRLSKAIRRSKLSPTRRFMTNQRPSPEVGTGSVPKFRMDGGSYTNQGVTSYQNYFREWTGVRTPNYKFLASKKRLPINPHTVTLVRAFDGGSLSVKDVSDNPSFSTLTHDAYGSHFGTADYGPTPSISPLSLQRNRAISRLRDRVIGETSNLSETVATFRKTADLIGSNARRIGSSITKLRRGNIPGAANDLFHGKPRYHTSGGPSKTKSLARNWLELQYGWKPLLQDVEYAVQALGKLALDDRTVGSSRASATASFNEGSLLRPNNAGSPPVVGEWYKTTTTTTKFTIRYRVASPVRAFLAQSGFTNPISLGWELLPFSFVVDWFLPVGQFLESLDSWGGLEFLDGCETTFTRVEAGYSRHYYGQRYPDGDLHSSTTWSFGGSYNYYGIALSRGKLSSFPAQNFPTVKNGLSFGHTLNALALLRGLFK